MLHFHISLAFPYTKRKVLFWIMILKTPEQPMPYDSPNVARIRQKIKEVFGWDCAMNDDMLIKQYIVTDDGDLIVKLK